MNGDYIVKPVAKDYDMGVIYCILAKETDSLPEFIANLTVDVTFDGDDRILCATFEGNRAPVHVLMDLNMFEGDVYSGTECMCDFISALFEEHGYSSDINLTQAAMKDRRKAA